jgi:flagellar assembly protein FliH
MTSLSNVIKSPEPVQQSKVVKLTAIVAPELDAINEKMDRQLIDQTLEERISRTKQQAARIIAAANQLRSETEERLKAQEEKAKKEQKAAYEQSQKAGYEAGFRKGSEAGKDTWGKSIIQANHVVDQSKTDYQERITRAEPDILKLSIAVAEKILGVTLASDEDKWFSLVSQAVREVRDQKTIKIIVPPAHFATLDIHKEELDMLVRDAEIFIYADREFGSNQCIIETEFGRIDAGIDCQLSVIKKKLMEIMEEQG